MTVYFVTLSLFYVSFVQQAVKQLVWRPADSTADRKPGILRFPCFGMLFGRLAAKTDGNYLHIIVHFSSFPAQEGERNSWVMSYAPLTQRQDSCRFPSSLVFLFQGWFVSRHCCYLACLWPQKTLGKSTSFALFLWTAGIVSANSWCSLWFWFSRQLCVCFRA